MNGSAFKNLAIALVLGVIAFALIMLTACIQSSSAGARATATPLNSKSQGSASATPTPAPQKSESGAGIVNPTGKPVKPSGGSTTQPTTPAAIGVPIGEAFSAEEMERLKQDAEKNPLVPCANAQLDSSVTASDCATPQP